jgi:hypothetical protein
MLLGLDFLKDKNFAGKIKFMTAPLIRSLNDKDLHVNYEPRLEG